MIDLGGLQLALPAGYQTTLWIGVGPASEPSADPDHVDPDRPSIPRSITITLTPYPKEPDPSQQLAQELRALAKRGSGPLRAVEEIQISGHEAQRFELPATGPDGTAMITLGIAICTEAGVQTILLATVERSLETARQELEHIVSSLRVD